MASSQRFCLRWNNHQTNLLSVFDQLLQDETFTDVTLAVEGQYLKAHKVQNVIHVPLLLLCRVIVSLKAQNVLFLLCLLYKFRHLTPIFLFQMVLSACSPYFQQIFVNHSEKDPIVILKDVPFSDMKSLLDFMYRGEVSVDQERLTAFLRVAESLRIKGLTEVNDDKPPSNKPSTPPPSQQHRLNPYLMQQQQQKQQQQRQSMESNQSKGSTPQTQGMLLGSALTGQKRKRGRPRKLSGSDVGEDYDEFDREGLVLVSQGDDLEFEGNESLMRVSFIVL